MAEGGLDQMNRRPAVEGVGGVGVAQPVRRNREIDAGATGGLADDAQHGHCLEGTVFARAEDGVLVFGCATDPDQRLGNGFRNLDGSGFLPPCPKP
jgi:hypothetical protein